MIAAAYRMESAIIISFVLLLALAEGSHTPRLRSRRHEGVEVNPNDTAIAPADTGGGNLFAGGTELSNRERAPRTSRGWSTWSSWSICSRLCDGGVSYQMRRCKSHTGCAGEATRYRLCNMLPCPEPSDFRGQQCAAYNGAIRAGRPRVWTPHYDPEEPCVLLCEGRPADADDFGRSNDSDDVDADVDAEQQTESTSADADDDVVIEQLAPQVQIGTRCRPGSLDMCISGKCQHVGCDLRVGSQKAVDACGICGGDGSSCGQPLYHWEEVATSLCTSQCGGGYRMTTAECRNRVTGQDVDEALCDQNRRPTNGRVPCNTHRCPAKWTTGEWEACSATCGSGWKVRQVYCSEEIGGNITKVAESLCHGNKPRIGERCKGMPCPVWKAGDWGKCSVSCGTGIEKRPVKCHDPGAPHGGNTSFESSPWTRCDSRRRPQDHRPCTLQPCPPLPPSEDGWISELDSDYSFPLVHPYPPAAEALIGNPGPSSSTWDLNHQYNYQSDTSSVSLNTARALAQTQSHSRNSEQEIRVGTVQNKTYRWVNKGYSACSASCLGGTQEIIYGCEGVEDGRPANPRLCPKTSQPEPLTRTCNEIPCPPRWQVTDFGKCSRPCGMGTQTREVKCVSALLLEQQPMVIEGYQCPQPPPQDRQMCNILDCPPAWTAGNWSGCSVSCGTGTRTRAVRCVQIMAQNHPRDRPDSACSLQEKPAEAKSCKVAVCGAGGADDGYTTSAPLIEADRGNYKQTKDDTESTVPTVDQHTASDTPPQ